MSPFTSTPASRARREAAYRAIDVDPALVRLQPHITSQLRMLSRKLHRRNLPSSPYYYLKFAPGEIARKIVALYYSLPRDQRDMLPIEAYCIAVGERSTEVFEIITRAVAAISRQTSAIIAASAHPAVVDKTVEMALTDEGIEDRNTLHKAVGFLPTPKGSQTTVNVAANASATAQSATVLAPPPEHTVRTLVDLFNEARGLPPASAHILPVAEADTLPAQMPYEDDERIPVEADDTSDDSDDVRTI